MQNTFPLFDVIIGIYAVLMVNVLGKSLSDPQRKQFPFLLHCRPPVLRFVIRVTTFVE